MTTIEEALSAYLLGQAAITAMIDQRLYPMNLPQNTPYPALTYEQVAEAGLMAHDGPGELVSGRYQFDCCSNDYDRAKLLAREVKRALNGYRGMMSDPSPGSGQGVNVAGIFFISELDIYEDAAKMFRVSIDFNLMYKEQ